MTTEERNAAWAELEAKGWEVRQTGYNTHVAYKDRQGRTGTFPTRDEAIDYALQLAQKEEK